MILKQFPGHCNLLQAELGRNIINEKIEEELSGRTVIMPLLWIRASILSAV
jgi:hypothetical protein